MWIASVEFGSKFAPKSLQGTMQGMIAGLYQGFAGSIGAVIGGFLYNNYGPVYMYRLSGLIVFGWTIVFNIILRTLKCLNNDSKSIKILFDQELIKPGEYAVLSIKNLKKRESLISTKSEQK